MTAYNETLDQAGKWYFVCNIKVLRSYWGAWPEVLSFNCIKIFFFTNL